MNSKIYHNNFEKVPALCKKLCESGRPFKVVIAADIPVTEDAIYSETLKIDGVSKYYQPRYTFPNDAKTIVAKGYHHDAINKLIKLADDNNANLIYFQVGVSKEKLPEGIDVIIAHTDIALTAKELLEALSKVEDKKNTIVVYSRPLGCTFAEARLEPPGVDQEYECARLATSPIGPAVYVEEFSNFLTTLAPDTKLYADLGIAKYTNYYDENVFFIHCLNVDDLTRFFKK